MKHKHAEMIKLKADNMDLVLLAKSGDKWVRSYNKFPNVENDHYYLCREKHKDTLLHLLNGGVVECQSKNTNDLIFTCTKVEPWTPLHWYMRDDVVSRIKPKKESRWIVVNVNEEVFCCESGGEVNVCSAAYFNEKTANYIASKYGGQVVEVKVEV